MELYTERLILRPWHDNTEDAAALYEYARDPHVGPTAGWPSHKSVDESREIIRSVLSARDTFAVVPADIGYPVGSIGLMYAPVSDKCSSADEAEIGYWIGVPFWGRGLMTEAALEIIRYAFHELQLTRLWCTYYDGNTRSRRVQEKCGFHFHHTRKNVRCELMNDIRTEHVMCLSKLD